jgi:hypothetical protein
VTQLNADFASPLGLLVTLLLWLLPQAGQANRVTKIQVRKGLELRKGIWELLNASGAQYQVP